MPTDDKNKASLPYVMTMDEIEERIRKMDANQPPRGRTALTPKKPKATTSPTPTLPGREGDATQKTTTTPTTAGATTTNTTPSITHSGDKNPATEIVEGIAKKIATNTNPTTTQKGKTPPAPKASELSPSGVGVTADDDEYGYDKILNILRGRGEQSAEEEERQRKRDHRDMLIRSIGDGISAIAGMAGSMAGAPNTVNHEMALTKSGLELRDKIRKEREERRDLYTRRALSAARIEAENRRTKSLAVKAQQQADLARFKAENAVEMAREKIAQAKSKEEFERQKSDALIALRERQLDIEAEYKAGMLSAAQKNAETQRINANANMIKAMKYQSGGGRSGGRSGGSSGKDTKETATDWMYRTQDEDPEGYKAAVKGALGYNKPYLTAQEASRVRSWYNHKYGISDTSGGASGGSGGGSGTRGAGNSRQNPNKKPTTQNGSGKTNTGRGTNTGSGFKRKGTNNVSLR